VLKLTDEYGLCNLKDMAETEFGNPISGITDVETLPVHAMGLRNKNQPNFESAEPWEPVKLDESGALHEQD